MESLGFIDRGWNSIRVETVLKRNKEFTVYLHKFNEINIIVV